MKPSKRLLKKRKNFIVPANAWGVEVDYLPDDHWIKFRMATCRKDNILFQLGFRGHSMPWFWNIYGKNR